MALTAKLAGLHRTYAVTGPPDVDDQSVASVEAAKERRIIVSVTEFSKSGVPSTVITLLFAFVQVTVGLV
jgi:hypothetical protein